MEEIVKELGKIVGPEHVSNHAEELFMYSRDPGTMEPKFPDYVVMPGSTEEVHKIMLLATEKGVPVVPMGGGLVLLGIVHQAVPAERPVNLQNQTIWFLLLGLLAFVIVRGVSLRCLFPRPTGCSWPLPTPSGRSSCSMPALSRWSATWPGRRPSSASLFPQSPWALDCVDVRE